MNNSDGEVSNAVRSKNSAVAVKMSLALPNCHFQDRNRSVATAVPSEWISDSLAKMTCQME